LSRGEEARKAYEKKDLHGLREAHKKERIEQEPWHDVGRGQRIKDVIYAASDGIVTTFAVVAGATGAMLSSEIIVILGFANLLADGVSMAVADYLGTRSEIEYADKERERETYEVENIPEAEKEEMRQIFRRRGLTEQSAERLAEIVSSDKKLWVEMMMTEELGIAQVERSSPWKGAGATFLSFVAAGFMPLLFFALSYALIISNTFILSVVTTLASLFIVGTLRVIVTRRNWLRSGLEVLAAGSVAAAVAYLIGYALRALVG
jgi:VIT1/CCC1 family predicted Fe2+/Mn2+ transporter